MIHRDWYRLVENGGLSEAMNESQNSNNFRLLKENKECMKEIKSLRENLKFFQDKAKDLNDKLMDSNVSASVNTLMSQKAYEAIQQEKEACIRSFNEKEKAL